MDNLQHPITMEDPWNTPRSAFYTRVKIAKIVRDTKLVDSRGNLSFDKLEVSSYNPRYVLLHLQLFVYVIFLICGAQIKSRVSTCYTYGIAQDVEDPDVGPGVQDDALCSFHLPRIRDMLAPKLRSLDEKFRAEAERELNQYDAHVLRETNKIAAAQRSIMKKQVVLAENIGKLLELHGTEQASASVHPPSPCPGQYMTMNFQLHSSFASCCT